MNLAPLEKAQVDGIEYGLKHPYSICAMDMGLGKSRVGLEIAHRRSDRTLIVCPSYLTLNWLSEIRKWFGDSKVVTLIKKKNQIYNLWDTDLCIVSYENSMYAEILFEWADFVIYDEGHYLKNMNAKRTTANHKYIFENSVDKLLVLTGTPIKNRVEEYYSLIALCNYNPRIKKSEFLERFPDSITFADYFSNREEYTVGSYYKSYTVLKWTGVKNKEELKSYLKGIYFRAVGAPGTTNYKPVIIGDGDNPELEEELEELELHPESLAGPAKLLAAQSMVPHTIEYCKNILDEVGQLVIYSDHVEPAEKIAHAFGVPAITGKMTPDDRHALATRFQSGETKVIVATIKSFSTGITLTAANNMVFNDPPWSPGDLSQAEKRIDRLGQTKKCVIHRMIGSKQDQKIYEILEQKSKVISEVT